MENLGSARKCKEVQGSIIGSVPNNRTDRGAKCKKVLEVWQGYVAAVLLADVVVTWW